MLLKAGYIHVDNLVRSGYQFSFILKGRISGKYAERYLQHNKHGIPEASGFVELPVDPWWERFHLRRSMPWVNETSNTIAGWY